MKKIMMLALAVVSVVAFSKSDAMAQDYQNSYRFGVGLGYGTQFPYPKTGHYGNRGVRPLRGLGLGFDNLGAIVDRVDAPPYFAQYPPVYYNGIISRPYGISPYAAPPGIMPVEMTIPMVIPQAIQNPYYEQQITPASENTAEPVNSTDNQSTHIYNPYVESVSSVD